MPLTVSQLNEYVRKTFAVDPMLRSVSLTGEISNFKRHTTGHLYFTLKDDNARIACVMFRSQTFALKGEPKDGQRVLLVGNVSLYAQTGQYQFYADSLQEDGVGTLFVAYERLKAALLARGVCDPALKKALPLLPRAVGIATSPTGAVRHDVEEVARRRHPGMQLILRPTAVQGAGAALEIAAAIDELDKHPLVDVIIVGRGGGSLEELWAFNELPVLEAIIRAKKPVISAVGHETDVTLSDLVADVRAATPSQAAELAVPVLSQLMGTLGMLRNHAIVRMERALGDRKKTLATLQARLLAVHPRMRLSAWRFQLATLHQRLQSSKGRNLQQQRSALSLLAARISALSPEAVFTRGYAMVTRNGRALLDVADAPVGTMLTVRLLQGTLTARTEEHHHEP